MKKTQSQTLLQNLLCWEHTVWTPSSLGDIENDLEPDSSEDSPNQQNDIEDNFGEDMTEDEVEEINRRKTRLMTTAERKDAAEKGHRDLDLQPG